MTRAAKLLGLLTGAALAFAVIAGPAQAANTRVSISDFQWSKQPTVNLGEKVIWDWIGPDTMHSITGQPPNATQWDSDPGTSTPMHPVGDQYSITFDSPGQYLFACKLHSSVRGTVTVTGQPGDPNSDPGPQPPINFDVTPPSVSEVSLVPPLIGPKGKGTLLKATIDERGEADADYYRLVKKRVGKKKKGRKGKKKRKVRIVRQFMGYTRWKTFIGYNEFRFAAKSPTFTPKPGRYEALFRVTDENHNMTEPVKLEFQINKAKKKKKKGKRRR
jgi:plastocyanin